MSGPDPSRREDTPVATVPVEITVDLAAIRHNVRTLADHVSRERPVALMVVVKADGYGHGMAQVAAAAREAGAPWLGVATPTEALQLRAGGDTGRALCWLVTPDDVVSGRLARVVAQDVDVAAYDAVQLRTVVAEAGSAAGSAVPRVHLKVDTGLSRGGAPREQWADFFAEAAALERDGRIVVAGLWSHLVASDVPDHEVNEQQEQAFAEALALAAAAGLQPEVRHLANSAAAVLRPSIHHDLVRCGIASYGLDPAPGARHDLGLVPAMTVRAPLVMVKDAAPGTGVSYGHLWVASEPTTLGLVPVGYADGVPRHASDRAEVLVAGERRPVRGRVCMDQLVVDLGGDRPEVGAEVVLFGPGADGEPTAQEWAEASGTISYEIVTRIGGRFTRRHVDSDRTSEEAG